MKCPRCKEELPLLSKICHLCNYVVDEGEGGSSASEFANLMECNLRDIKALPKPTFIRSMWQLSLVVLPILSIALLILSIISSAGIFWVICSFFTIMTIVVWILKMIGRLGNSYSDNHFSKIKNEYEYNMRLARRDFGKSREVNNLLNEISEKIDEIEMDRKSAYRKNLLIWLILILFIVLISSGSIFGVLKAVEDPTVDTTVITEDEMTTEQIVTLSGEEWKAAIERFKSSEHNDEYGDNAERIKVIKHVLAADELEVAEEFFRKYSMGLMGDYDCARLIIDYYISQDNRDMCQEFIKNISMRYNSDKNKLTKLITK